MQTHTWRLTHLAGREWDRERRRCATGMRRQFKSSLLSVLFSGWGHLVDSDGLMFAAKELLMIFRWCDTCSGRRQGRVCASWWQSVTSGKASDYTDYSDSRHKKWLNSLEFIKNLMGWGRRESPGCLIKRIADHYPPDGAVCESGGFISRIHLLKSPKTTFGRGRSMLWLDKRLSYSKWTNQVEKLGTARRPILKIQTLRYNPQVNQDPAHTLHRECKNAWFDALTCIFTTLKMFFFLMNKYCSICKLWLILHFLKN